MLVHAFHDAASSAAPVARILLAGTARDLLVGLTVVLPLLVILAAFRLRWLARPWRQHVIVAAMPSPSPWTPSSSTSSRSTTRVTTTLPWTTWPIPTRCWATSSPVTTSRRWWRWRPRSPARWRSRSGACRPPTFDDWSLRDRARALGITALLAVGVGVGWRLDPVSVAGSRVDDELAQNGWVQLLAAFRTAHLDYEAYYALVPSREADARVARLIGQPRSSTGLCIRLRHIGPRRRGRSISSSSSRRAWAAASRRGSATPRTTR